MLMGTQPQPDCTVAFLVVALRLNAKINNDRDDCYLQAEKSHTLLNLMLNNNSNFFKKCNKNNIYM